MHMFCQTCRSPRNYVRVHHYANPPLNSCNMPGTNPSTQTQDQKPLQPKPPKLGTNGPNPKTKMQNMMKSTLAGLLWL